MNWTVLLTRRFDRDFDALPERVQRAVDPKLDQLTEDPFALDIAKLHGTVDLWRVRVGDYRLIVRIEQSERAITVLRVRHRREAYRG